jgi:hypothetical protein
MLIWEISCTAHASETVQKRAFPGIGNVGFYLGCQFIGVHKILLDWPEYVWVLFANHVNTVRNIGVENFVQLVWEGVF